MRWGHTKVRGKCHFQFRFGCHFVNVTWTKMQSVQDQQSIIREVREVLEKYEPRLGEINQKV